MRSRFVAGELSFGDAWSGQVSGSGGKAIDTRHVAEVIAFLPSIDAAAEGPAGCAAQPLWRVTE
ncbi:Hypothetical protein A7982_02376 [Minicystis rosea]|nr:Hypothetical protein A7982_02376 [Minicystis rosea]